MIGSEFGLALVTGITASWVFLLLALTRPRFLRRWWIWINTSPIDVIAPPDWSEARERQLLRGLSEIHRATADNLYHFDPRRQRVKAAK